jgi:UDP-glucose 4-epimerase
MKKIVVFGGSGFLGSHVADILTEKGFDTTIFDIKTSPYLKPNQKMIVGDIRDERLVMESLNQTDIVYNFAGIADIDEANEKPLDTVKNNILGNTIILEACHKQKVKRFVFASSIYVYSDSGSFYRCSKQACELITESYHEKYGIDFTILRYGSLYGPRSDMSNWIYDMLMQAIENKKIVRHGDGEELREYIHVLDAARMSVEILKDEYKNQYVIVTGNQQLKMKDLLTMVKEMLKGNLEIEYTSTLGSEHYEITPYVFNPKLAKRIVLNDYIDLGQGLLNMLDEIHTKTYK